MVYIHNINPVLLQLGSISIYYYSIPYIMALFAIPWYVNLKYINDKKLSDSLGIYIALGVLCGGRIFYIIFYDLQYYITNPSEILQIWHGGMSFHGGAIGYCIGIFFYSKKNRLIFFKILDLSCLIVPICLFFGRICNFINGELPGRPTNGSWGVVFPSDSLLRHPSQLYEAILEGLFIFIALFILSRTRYGAINGFISKVFLGLYGLSRFIVEFWREPDPQIGYILIGLTMGQILCLFMMFASLYLLYQKRI